MKNDKSPSYVVFGYSGTMGKAFSDALASRTCSYKTFAFDHPRVDITNPSHVKPLLEYIKPTVVVNCAYLSDMEICEDAQEGAMKVNAEGPRVLAEACRAIGAKLVHVSSSCVLEGRNGPPCSERCRTNPQSAYGKSRLAGEKAVLETPSNLVLRTGWIFNHEGCNWLTNWLKAAESGEAIHAISDCHGSPTYAMDMVEASVGLIEEWHSGLYHVANTGGATWLEFAKASLDLTGLKPNIKSHEWDKQEFFKAKMPKKAILSTKKLAAAGKQLRPWKDALKHCLFLMNKYKP